MCPVQNVTYVLGRASPRRRSTFQTPVATIRQRPRAPSCGGQSPYRGENSGPDRHNKESLTSNPRVREQPRLIGDVCDCVYQRPLTGGKRTFDTNVCFAPDYVCFTPRCGPPRRCSCASANDPGCSLTRGLDVKLSLLCLSAQGKESEGSAVGSAIGLSSF